MHNERLAFTRHSFGIAVCQDAVRPPSLGRTYTWVWAVIEVDDTVEIFYLGKEKKEMKRKKNVFHRHCKCASYVYTISKVHCETTLFGCSNLPLDGWVVRQEVVHPLVGRTSTTHSFKISNS